MIYLAMENKSKTWASELCRAQEKSGCRLLQQLVHE